MESINAVFLVQLYICYYYVIYQSRHENIFTVAWENISQLTSGPVHKVCHKIFAPGEYSDDSYAYYYFMAIIV